MSEYKTEQKRLLLEFLAKNGDRSYTIDEIVDGIYAAAGASSLGKSTVYRLMTRLVEEKQVMRRISNGSRKASYRIIADEHCHYHLHLQCTDCGKILHLDEKISDELLDTVKKLNDFSVSEEETVLMGRCSSCALCERVKK